MAILTDEQVKQVRQFKIDATCATLLHNKRLSILSLRSKLLDFLAIAVPILYFVIRFAAKETQIYRTVELVWESISALLLALAIWKVTMSWEDRTRKHFYFLRRNQSLRTDAERILIASKQISLKEFEAFVEKAREMEADDLEILSGFSLADRQSTYREALRQDNPGANEVDCPYCQAPVINGFKAGNCKKCGGTPRISSKQDKSVPQEEKLQ